MSGDTAPVPLTIVTGFLGSGKTTLINFMLEEVGPKEKLAIVKNEIGDVAVDSKIIRGENILMKELLNGCVCCTLVGELEESLKELVDTVHPARIIIEASGAANPAILAVNIDRLDFVKRDLIICVIDVLNFEGYKDKTIIGHLQHKFTDLVVLNRVGDVDEDTIDKVLDDVYELRPGIPVVRTATGRVHPDILFGLAQGRKRIELGGCSEKELHEDHMHEDNIESFTFTSDVPVNRECFEDELKKLSEEYYRVKGFVKFAGARRHRMINFVCGRYELDVLENDVDTGLGENESKVAFIGKNVARYRESVLGRLEKCGE